MILNDLQIFSSQVIFGQFCKVITTQFGFGHVWIEQGVGNIKLFLRIFKERLTDNFLQGRDDGIHNSSRAKTYKLISNFSFKDYLDFVTVRKFSYAFTRLCVASHHLEIKTGRWHTPNRTPGQERKCLFVIVWKMKSLCFEMSILSRFTQRIYKNTFGIGQMRQNLLSYYSQKIRKLLPMFQFTYVKLSKTEMNFYSEKYFFYSLLFLKI